MRPNEQRTPHSALLNLIDQLSNEVNPFWSSSAFNVNLQNRAIRAMRRFVALDSPPISRCCELVSFGQRTALDIVEYTLRAERLRVEKPERTPDVQTDVWDE
jgi:hypothetical protein